MSVTTYHQYIDHHPAKTDDKRMILGTIHPHSHQNFKIPFFYGNEASIWNILEDAFPLQKFSSMESIKQVLTKHNVWITDIIRSCDRTNEKVVRDDLLYNLIINKEQVSDALNETQISTIFLTSRFGKNNAAKLFVSTFKIDYLATFSETTSEFTIPGKTFGREIRCIALYSPSGSANRGISRCKPYLANISNYRQFPYPVKQFKIEFYRDKFQFLNPNHVNLT